MSASTTRATRRDLRRAVGEDGLAAIGEAQANISKLANSLAQAHGRIDGHAALIEKTREQLEAVEIWARVQDQCYAGDLVWLQTFRRRGFWGRLKLLVTGK